MFTLRPLEWEEWGKAQYAFAAEFVRRAANGVTNASLRDDASFGPQFGSQFDFSMLFSNAFFAILPASLIISVSLVYIMWYWDALKVTSKRLLFGAKTVRTMHTSKPFSTKSSSVLRSSAFGLRIGSHGHLAARPRCQQPRPLQHNRGRRGAVSR